MPTRNLLVLCLAAVLSLACYHRASHNRYASVIADAIGEIHSNFVEPIDRRELFEGSMRGMVRQLDENSGFVDQEDYERLLEDLDQEFGGVGIIVDVDPDTERLMVLSPFMGTPAYEAGIRAGDLILAIEGQDTEGMESRDSVKLIRGAPGTPVNVTIQPFGTDQTREVTLVRAVIPVESVLGDRRIQDGSWEFFLEEDPRIGYIRMSSFGENSARDLAAALRQILGSVDGLILDLRQNPGGLLEAAVEVSDLFLDQGVIVSIKGRGREMQQEFYASEGHLVPDDLPLVVLIDHFSASASEIVSACLQDRGRATVIGERSFGKGTVQSVFELEGGRSALRLTTATYWRPSGRNIHRLTKSKESDPWGVSPNDGFEIKLEREEFLNVLRARRARDVVMTRSGNPAAKDELPADEQPTDETNAADDESAASDPSAATAPGVDRQLEKAIEFLQTQMQSPPASAKAA